MKSINYTISPIKHADKEMAKILLQGDLTLPNLSEIYSELADSAMLYDDLEIIVRNAEGFDLAAFQLFYALKQTYIQRNKKLNFDIEIPADIKLIFEKAGIDNFNLYLDTQ